MSISLSKANWLETIVAALYKVLWKVLVVEFYEHEHSNTIASEDKADVDPILSRKIYMLKFNLKIWEDDEMNQVS